MVGNSVLKLTLKSLFNYWTLNPPENLAILGSQPGKKY